MTPQQLTEEFVDGPIDGAVIRAADREYAAIVEADFGRSFESLEADLIVNGQVAA